MQKSNLGFSLLKLKKQIKIRDKDLLTFPFWHYIMDTTQVITTFALYRYG